LLNSIKIENFKHIHMIGIGGTSMSGIAEILLSRGHIITGSDIYETKITKRLQDTGIKVFIPHMAENVIGADLVIYSAAIKNDNPEMVMALNNNIPTLERCEALGELTKIYPETIAVSGTHGKTTTTSMISLCFIEDNTDPSIQVGADISNLNANYRVGKSDYFIIEACEYVESFLKFYPKTEIILNIEEDHLDYYSDINHIKSSFSKFIDILPKDSGTLIVNADDENCIDVAQKANCNLITYGITNPNVDFTAKNIVFDDNGFAQFDVYYKNNLYTNIKLSIPGMHNVQNSLACIATCHKYNISKESIKNGLAKFSGACRRFEFKGKFNDVSVFDDYAHHPTEIEATLKILNNKKFNKSWVVFQPHTYTRTKAFLNDFAKCLLSADNIIITDIYAAREKDPGDISSKQIADEIIKLGKNVNYISDFNDIINHIKENASPNDIVLTIGAGTVTEIASKLVNE